MLPRHRRCKGLAVLQMDLYTLLQISCPSNGHKKFIKTMPDHKEKNIHFDKKWFLYKQLNLSEYLQAIASHYKTETRQLSCISVMGFPQLHPNIWIDGFKSHISCTIPALDLQIIKEDLNKPVSVTENRHHEHSWNVNRILKNDKRPQAYKPRENFCRRQQKFCNHAVYLDALCIKSLCSTPGALCRI